MAAITGWSRAIDRVARACAAPFDDSRSLQRTLLDEIRRVVGFDAYAWLLTDPETEVGCSPLADVPCLPELPTLIRLKYLTRINRWTAPTLPSRVCAPRLVTIRSRAWSGVTCLSATE